MIEVLRKKAEKHNPGGNVSVQRCSFNDLSVLGTRKFDHIFSNFGGLNCAMDIDKVLNQFRQYLTPGGKATLVVMPPFCPWETFLALKGNLKIAFRRLKKKDAAAQEEGSVFKTSYFRPGRLKKAFGTDYKSMAVLGLGIVVPRPYLHKKMESYPGLFRKLAALETKICHSPPFRCWADHCIVIVQIKPF